MKDIVTAVDIINEQAQLERDAQATLPGKFETCTFNQGYIRQPLYACKTCSPPPKDTERDAPETKFQPAGMCYSCSIACHADHVLYELFPKRHFRCDCGVKGKFDEHRCELAVVEKQNVSNKDNCYNHNFIGRYCRCNEEYDPSTEVETMYQCVLCEDWFHERCIGNIPDKFSDFESYACRACVKKHPYIVNQDQRFNIGICRPDEPIYQWIGHGITTDLSSSTQTNSSEEVNSSNSNSAPDTATTSANQTTSTEAITIINNCHSKNTNNKLPDNSINGDTNDKRKRDELADQEEALDVENKPKKSKPERGDMCKNLHGVTKPGELIELFLDESWREGLCQCDKCYRQYKVDGIEFLLHEEKTFEPEEDEDAGKSLMEIGMEQLGKMDRVEALDGLRIYHTMLNQIKPFLQTFKDSGKVVTARDIQSFFDQKRQEREEQKKNRSLS
ncbi:hypothetical protein BCR42DRAFT_423629 [Absidia repens]|uniref:UBR-type domain-containing protein n=1 Tax=Absidia repens TaxID=90262 RepID=A0A1X2I5B5_9FUNG|nr:hypothetical protein BCR42DRAFT_423629 [Absidia repens]